MRIITEEGNKQKECKSRQGARERDSFKTGNTGNDDENCVLNGKFRSRAPQNGSLDKD